jgi:hypothetical protein
MVACGLVLLTAVLAACGEASDSDSEALALGPEATFSALEERFLSAASVEVEGGVRDWVVVEGFSFDEAVEVQDGSRVVSFSMIVGGVPAGTAALELGSRGSPIVRRQTVRFPTGEMRVVERYTRVLISPRKLRSDFSSGNLFQSQSFHWSERY